jgi:phytoene dehydrogenase-like protein
MKALVIDNGIDALVAAHTLARAGHEVTVLGGRREGEAHAGWIPRHVIASLDLEPHGLDVRWADPWVSAPLADGRRLTLWNDVQRSMIELARCRAMAQVLRAHARDRARARTPL